MFVRMIAPAVQVTINGEVNNVPQYVRDYLIPAGIMEWGNYKIGVDDTTGAPSPGWCIAAIDTDKVAELRITPGYFIFPDFPLDAKCLDMIPQDMNLCIQAMNTHGIVATTGANVTDSAMLNGITNGSKFREFIERTCRFIVFGQWDHTNPTMISDELG